MNRFPDGGHKRSLLWHRWFQSQVVGAVGKNPGGPTGEMRHGHMAVEHSNHTSLLDI